MQDAHKLRPVTALSATLSTICGLVVLHTTISLALYAALLSLALVFSTRRLGPLWIIAKWVLPFLVPLLIIHGFLNASFPANYWLFDFLPLRKEGLEYGVAVSLNVLVLAQVAIFWLQTSQDEVVEAFIRMRLPLWAVLFASQSIAVASLVEIRLSKTYLAQRARGIRVGPSMLARIRAFPSVLIPAAVTTLLEAENRVPALVSRGFGSFQIAPLQTSSMTPMDHLNTAMPMMVLVATWFLQGYL
jgi:energy-coupling factor transporter transmembrane protein EcfT